MLLVPAEAALPKLAGPARAAVLLLAMGQSGASRLLKHLSPDELKALRRGAVDQRPVSPQELDELVSEFQEAFKAGPGLSALDREMSTLLKGALSPEELSVVYEDENGKDVAVSSRPVWEELAELGAEQLQPLLFDEHPQIVALILTRLSPDVAAVIVAAFTPALRNEVLRRMLVVRPLNPSAEQLVENQLRQVFIADAERSGRSARHAGLAEIVNRMEKNQADEMLASIAETAPEEAAAIRRLLFAFEDLPNLSKKARLVLFDEISADTVTVALSGAPDDLKEVVLSSLAARTRRMVEAELSSGRDLDAKDVTAARRSIAALALRLSREGRIVLGDPDEA